MREKLSESTLSISDVPENYVGNSWGPKQRFGINQPSGRAQLKSHHIPKLRVPRQKRRKSIFLDEKWYESISSLSDVPETYVGNSWGLKQRFGINQPSGRAQLKSHHIPKRKGTPVKNAENRHFCAKSYLKVLYILVMFLKIMLGIAEVLSNVLVLISQVAALNWSHTIYPNLGYPVKNAENRHYQRKSLLRVFYLLVVFLKVTLGIVEVLSNVLVLISQVAALNWSDTIYPNLGYPRQKSTFLNEKLSKSILFITDVPENYVGNSWGLKQRFGINQPSGRAQLKSHHIPKLSVSPSKTPKIDIFARKVIWKNFIH